MPGETCWLGAGCFNWARSVLRAFWSATRQGDNIGTPQGEIRGQQENKPYPKSRSPHYYITRPESAVGPILKPSSHAPNR